MEEPHHKLTRKTMGVIFILALIVLIVILYLYYFKSQTKPLDSQTDNSVTDESADLNNTSREENTTSTNFDTKNNESDNTPPKASSPSDAYSLLAQTRTLYSSQRYDEALVIIDQAIQLKKDEPNFYLLKADILVMLNRKTDALAALNEGLVKNPGDTNISNKIEVISEIVK